MYKKGTKSNYTKRFILLLGDLAWEANGTFGPADVHHQVCIVFKTPSYLDSDIKESKHVKVQLVRTSDNEKSAGRDFTFIPAANTREYMYIHVHKHCILINNYI